MRLKFLALAVFLFLPLFGLAQGQCSTPNFYPWSYELTSTSAGTLAFDIQPQNNCIVFVSDGSNFKIKLRNPNTGYDQSFYSIAVYKNDKRCGVINIQYNGYYGGKSPAVSVQGDGLSYSNNLIRVGKCD